MDEKEIREVAEQFFYQYIVDQLHPVAYSDAIESIAELISYGGDLAVIRQKMALDGE